MSQESISTYTINEQVRDFAYKERHLKSFVLYNESDETNIATFTKEGASRKYYTLFYILIQPV